MTRESLEPTRISTGVSGLDVILEGGLLTGGVYIIEGPPGAGKTTLGSQFAFSHAKAGGRAVYVTLLAESYSRLVVHLRRMAFFDPTLVPERIQFLSAFKILEAEGLESLLTAIRRMVMDQQASVLIVDGLVSAEEASRSAKDFKKFIHELQTVVSMVGCTALLLNSTERPRGFRPELTMVDGVIELSDEVQGVRSTRSLVVKKMRGTAQLTGRHVVEIGDHGMHVVPRLESLLARNPEPAPPASRERASIGVPALDAMLHGGLPTHSMTAVAGPPGSGKSLLGLHFLSAGVAAGESVLHFGLYDAEHGILARSRSFGLALHDEAGRSLFHTLAQQPVEANIDSFVDRLLAAVRRTSARRLCIDGSQGFEMAAETPHRLREVFCALDRELAASGVTTLYTMETQPVFGRDVNLSATGMSASTQNIILLAHQPDAFHIRRHVSVLKMRDSGHESCIREFEITGRGIEVRATEPTV